MELLMYTYLSLIVTDVSLYNFSFTEVRSPY